MQKAAAPLATALEREKLAFPVYVLPRELAWGTGIAGGGGVSGQQKVGIGSEPTMYTHHVKGQLWAGRPPSCSYSIQSPLNDQHLTGNLSGVCGGRT